MASSSPLSSSCRGPFLCRHAGSATPGCVRYFVHTQRKAGSDACEQLQKQNDPNLSMLPSDHPFMSVASLEAEGVELMKGIFTILYTSK